jgi:hypothetical protein
MLMRRHEGHGVHEDAELPSAQGERVQVQLTDRGIGTEKMMTPKRASRDHQGVAGDHEAWLSHERPVRMKRARIPASDSKALPQLDWRIPSPSMADANLGEVAPSPSMADANLGEVAAPWVRLLLRMAH